MELDLPTYVTREQIERLQGEMANLPQAELVTEHQFNGGMYMRKLYRPAGTLIVGKVHKVDHFFLCAKGEIIAWSEGGMKRLQAGDVIESKAGTKRVTLAVQDSIGITIHKTDKTDLDEIEAELIEPDEMALFDSANKLKFDVPEFRELTKKVIAAEKVGFWSDWTKEQQELYTSGDWLAFSKSRGYSEEEISNYSKMRDLIAFAQSKGLNPYNFILDLTTEAAEKNILLDKNSEIMKSSHLPFEFRGETA
jgi:quercetin dioxygenase-like cupin family protein